MLLDERTIQIAVWIFAVLWFLRIGWAVAGRKASLRRHFATVILTASSLLLIAMIARETHRRMGGHYAPADDTAPADPYVNYRNDIEEV
jgi:hypothetical protein